MPKHEKQSSDVDVPKTIQNLPIQMMERQEDPAATSPTDRIPSHVFNRTKSNNQWSTASNESLFSIHMGTMSFSNDIAFLSKSGELDNPIDHNHLSKSSELDKPIDHNHNHNISDGFQTNHHPILPQPQGTKFNAISQNFGEQDGGSRVTEEKAAETMRQVIMESSVKQESKSKGDTASATAAARSKLLSSSNNDHSPHSDGSTRSYAFKVMTDGDKTPSAKRNEDVRNQVKQPVQQNVKGTPAAAQNPKSTPNASQNKWLSCFTCCH
ncbi:hypothetical protein MtrunA17_Chr3g0086921 [Medicago truncatula]|nr:uncharacterized protein LOC11418604 [Medicago truncatula]RHN66083.1 hypothetical protein MtrunA17_Chr3g0086921 [Medicago truncatula]